MGTEMLRIDFHSHCLPQLDDGARDVETAHAMLQMLSEQGIERAVMTPHYYAAQDTVEQFLKRRQRALERVANVTAPRLLTGAEVYLDREVVTPDLPQLCITGTDILLMEMPFMPLAPWMIEALEDVLYTLRCRVMLAHLTRYMPYYRSGDFEQLLSLPQVIVQINTEALLHRFSRRQVKKWLTDGVPIVFGSDAHNLTDRRPQFDKACRFISRSHGGVVPADAANALAEQWGCL